MKIYQYPKCSTCRKAVKFLKQNAVEFEEVNIVETPPTIAELQQMLLSLDDKKKLFNTSGLQYRELKLKNKLPEMKDEEALALLASNGMLIKRPFLLGKNIALVGFNEAIWDEAL